MSLRSSSSDLWRSLLWCVVFLFAISAHALPSFRSDHDALQSRASNSTLFEQDPHLHVFQVGEPVYIPPQPTTDQSACTIAQTLIHHSFGNSYWDPFVSNYTPPACAFNRVVMTYSANIKGVQFDRLGVMYLGDVEIFRTSTAEPKASGIEWSWDKDMTPYLALWRKPQTLVLAIPNIIAGPYNGVVNVDVNVTFWTDTTEPVVADTILPISALRSASGSGSAWGEFDGDGDSEHHEVKYSNPQFPQNVERAIVTISANGQIGEEFWPENVLDSDTKVFDAEQNGASPFREVQLLIDEQLVGTVWPFPVVFTGGIVPSFWRPIVGIDTFDLRQYEIDITPWLGVLCNGASHTFRLQVVGLDDDGRGNATISKHVGHFWVTSGTIFIFSANSTQRTTGDTPTAQIRPPLVDVSSHIIKDEANRNMQLDYTVNVARQHSFTSTITTAAGTKQVTWSQDLTYSSVNNVTDYGIGQSTKQLIQGKENGTDNYSHQFSFPYSSYEINDFTGGRRIKGNVTQGLQRDVWGPTIFPRSVAYTMDDGNNSSNVTGLSTDATSQAASTRRRLTADPVFLSHFRIDTNLTAHGQYSTRRRSENYGDTTQQYLVTGPSGAIYSRHVSAANDTLLFDNEEILNIPVQKAPAAPTSDDGMPDLVVGADKWTNSTGTTDLETPLSPSWIPTIDYSAVGTN